MIEMREEKRRIEISKKGKKKSGRGRKKKKLKGKREKGERNCIK